MKRLEAKYKVKSKGTFLEVRGRVEKDCKERWRELGHATESVG